VKKVRWLVVWSIVSPIVFFTAAVWYWQLFCLPTQQTWVEAQNKNYELSSQINLWRMKYTGLLRQANYLAVENAALNRTFDKLSGLSLQQTINETTEISQER